MLNINNLFKQLNKVDDRTKYGVYGTKYAVYGWIRNAEQELKTNVKVEENLGYRLVVSITLNR